MKIKNNNKGITLISLMITVIVLIILTSITMMMFNDDNDTSTVDEAKNVIEKETSIKVKEEVLFAVMQSMDIYKKIDLDKLSFLLELNDDNKITELPANIEKDGYSFTINADGTIEERE